MCPAEVVEKTIAYGPQRFRVNAKGKWMVMVFGTTPYSAGHPHWSWMAIKKETVPREVRILGERQ